MVLAESPIRVVLLLAQSLLYLMSLMVFLGLQLHGVQHVIILVV